MANFFLSVYLMNVTNKSSYEVDVLILDFYGMSFSDAYCVLAQSNSGSWNQILYEDFSTLTSTKYILKIVTCRFPRTGSSSRSCCLTCRYCTVSNWIINKEEHSVHFQTFL